MMSNAFTKVKLLQLSELLCPPALRVPAAYSLLVAILYQALIVSPGTEQLSVWSNIEENPHSDFWSPFSAHLSQYSALKMPAESQPKLCSLPLQQIDCCPCLLNHNPRWRGQKTRTIVGDTSCASLRLGAPILCCLFPSSEEKTCQFYCCLWWTVHSGAVTMLCMTVD